MPMCSPPPAVDRLGQQAPWREAYRYTQYHHARSHRDDISTDRHLALLLGTTRKRNAPRNETRRLESSQPGPALAAADSTTQPHPFLPVWPCHAEQTPISTHQDRDPA